MSTREIEMCQMYRDGKTLQEIGDVYGVTRERVRQLIRPLGVTWKDGGFHKTAAAKKQANDEKAAARREARALRVYGCSYAELKRINYGMQLSDIGSPAYKYMRDRCNNVKLGRAFKLTLPEWVGLFEQAGGLLHRGLFSDGLVLSRVDKSGDCVMGNVRVLTLSENTRDTRLREHRSAAA
jgi:hypothetical protein